MKCLRRQGNDLSYTRLSSSELVCLSPSTPSSLSEQKFSTTLAQVAEQCQESQSQLRGALTAKPLLIKVAPVTKANNLVLTI